MSQHCEAQTIGLDRISLSKYAGDIPSIINGVYGLGISGMPTYTQLVLFGCGFHHKGSNVLQAVYFSQRHSTSMTNIFELLEHGLFVLPSQMICMVLSTRLTS